MKRFKLNVIAAVVSVGLFVSGTAVANWASDPQTQRWARELGVNLDLSYEATRTMETKDGAMSFKEYRTPRAMRMDMNMQGMETSVIMRDDNTAVALMHSLGMYREISSADTQNQAPNMDFSKIEYVGAEEVDGYDTKKYKTQFKDDNGRGGGYVWVTDDDGLLIKMDMIYANRGNKGQRMKMGLSGIRIGSQPGSLFVVSENLKPMSLGNLGAMGGANTGTVPASTSDAAQVPADDDDYQEPGLGEEMGDTAKDEVKYGVKNEIGRGIRDIFRRNR